ncbi:MAG: MFS transporter [Rhodobacteraceae bacterium]|nr:MFS transporter [Paracoccaceae bacterium]MBR9819896.1 MFS transporter [Paracoccaceae bacterium]
MTEQELFAQISGAEDEAPDRREGRNGLREIAALSMTKISDGLIDPKLVLSWLLNALGAPAAFVTALVPIREAGALLPQILLAAKLETLARRKWMWATGAALQGLAALVIAASGLLLEGWMAGLAICAALAVLALARAACSVSFKEVQGKTIAKTRRGAVTGTASSLASVAVVTFALLLLSGLLQDRGAVVVAVALAGVLWLVAGALFSTLKEPVSEAEETSGLPPLRATLREDADLRRFIAVRGLLVPTALAPPYIVLLSQQGGEGLLGQLGALLLASALASFLSSYVWGRLADRSSRRVLSAAGFAGAAAMALMLGLLWAGLAQAVWAGPAVLFLLMVAYHGVRQARSTYLVDLAPEDARGRYAAVANTMIGSILLLAGLFGGAVSTLSAAWALAGFAAVSALGGALALTLREVERG